jgi:hypothetical protein
LERLNPNRYSVFFSDSFDGFMQVPYRILGTVQILIHFFTRPIQSLDERRTNGGAAPLISPSRENTVGLKGKSSKECSALEMRNLGVLNHQSQDFSWVSNDDVLTDLFSY